MHIVLLFCTWEFHFFNLFYSLPYSHLLFYPPSLPYFLIYLTRPFFLLLNLPSNHHTPLHLFSLYIIIIAGGTLLNLLSKFATCVSDGVDGKGSTDGGVEMNDLYGGARISYIFNEVRMCTPALHPPLFMFLHPFNWPPPHAHTQTL